MLYVRINFYQGISYQKAILLCLLNILSVKINGQMTRPPLIIEFNYLVLYFVRNQNIT